MPQIVEYNANGGQAPTPTDRALDTAREAGATRERMGRISGEAVAGGYRSLGSAISQGGVQIAQEVEKHQTFHAIGQGAVVYSSMFANLTDSWNKLASGTDPNDQSISQGFREKTLEPALQNFQKAFEGSTDAAQGWAQQRADEMRQHFFVKTTADMGVRAADAVQQNMRNSVQNYSVLVGNDPTALQHSIDSFHSDLDAQLQSSPYLDAQQASRIHNEIGPRADYLIAKSAGDAMGKANPDEYINAINKGDFDKYFTGEQKIEAVKYAEGVKRANFEDQQRQDVIQRRETEKQQKETMNGYLTNILTGDKKDVAKSIATDESLDPLQRENLINFQREHVKQLQEKKDNTPHPEEFRAQLNQMFAQARANPDNLNIQNIRDAFSAGKLNPTEEAQLEQRFKSMDSPMEQNYHNQISHVDTAIRTMPQFAAQPEQGVQVINQIDYDAHRKLDQYRKEGKDITPLLDPKSSDYLFSPSKIQSYMPNAKQSMAEQADKIRKGGAAITAGTVQAGYRFKGGNPADQTNWEKAE